MVSVLFYLMTAVVVNAAENPEVTRALQTSLEASVFKATLAEGYHFNDKAPNLLTVDGESVKPKEIKPRTISFPIAKKSYAQASAALYICDDQNTFCEPRLISIKGEASAVEAGKSGTPNEVKKNSHGFIEDNLDAAKTIAVASNKLILLDFSARWCPGCVRYETETFDRKEFKGAASPYVKVKLDVDKFQNTKLKEKYGIAAIPTLIVVNQNLEEISRIVDYQPLPVVQTFLREAATNPQTFAELKAKADSDQSASLMLGRRLYNASKYSDAVKYLEKVKPEPVELLDAKLRASEPKADTDKAKFQKVALEAIQKEPNSSRSIVWRTLLCEALPKGDPARKKLAAEGMQVADALLEDDKKLKTALAGDWVGEFTGYEKLLIALNRASLAEVGELGDEAVAAASAKAAEVGKKLNIPASKTGPSMRLYLAFMGAKQYDDAEKQIRKLLARDPKNPELQRRALRVFNETKKFAEGIKLGKEALAHSYGKNEVWVAQQLAKAYTGNNQKLEARALINSYLSRKDIDWSVLKKEQTDLKEQLAKLSTTN